MSNKLKQLKTALTTTNPKNSQLAEKKRAKIGKYVEISRKISDLLETGASKSDSQYKKLIADAEERFNDVLSITNKGKEILSSGAIAFEEGFLLGNTEDKIKLNDFSQLIEALVFDEAGTTTSEANDYKSYLKPIIAKVPKYDGQDLMIITDDDGNVFPAYEDKTIGYSLGGTQEEAEQNLARLINSVKESNKYEIEQLRDQIGESTNGNINLDNILGSSEVQDKIISEALSAVSPQLVPAIRNYLLSFEGQNSLKQSLSMIRYNKLLPQYTNKIYEENIRNNNGTAVPTTAFGQVLLERISTEGVDEQGNPRLMSGFDMLKNTLIEEVQKALQKSPDLLNNYEGDVELDNYFQDLLHNSTDFAIGKINVIKGPTSQRRIFEINKPNIVQPRPQESFMSRASNFMQSGAAYGDTVSGMQHMLGNNPQPNNNFSNQNNNAPTLPNNQDNREDNIIKENAQAYTPNANIAVEISHDDIIL